MLRVEMDITQQVMDGIREGLGEALDEIALRVEKKAKAAIQTGPKTGKVYRRGRTTRSGGSRNTALFGGMIAQKKGGKGLQRDDKNRIITGYKFHRASRSGEAPANDLGLLANSLQTRKRGKWTREVTVGAEYGAALEEGRNRPFVQPAVDAVEPQIEEIVQDAVDRHTPR